MESPKSPKTAPPRSSSASAAARAPRNPLLTKAGQRKLRDLAAKGAAQLERGQPFFPFGPPIE